MDIRQHVLDRLAAHRLQPYELARDVAPDVATSTLYRWLRGDANISVESAGHVLDALGSRLQNGRRPARTDS